jgi:hypothetical protein
MKIIWRRKCEFDILGMVSCSFLVDNQTIFGSNTVYLAGETEGIYVHKMNGHVLSLPIYGFLRSIYHFLHSNMFF